MRPPIVQYLKLGPVAQATRFSKEKLVRFAAAGDIRLFISIPDGYRAKRAFGTEEDRAASVLFMDEDRAKLVPVLLNVKPSVCAKLAHSRTVKVDQFPCAICDNGIDYERISRRVREYSSIPVQTSPHTDQLHGFKVVKYRNYVEIPAWSQFSEEFEPPSSYWIVHPQGLVAEQDQVAYPLEISQDMLYISTVDRERLLNPEQFQSLPGPLCPTFAKKVRPPIAVKKNLPVGTDRLLTSSPRPPRKCREDHEKRRQYNIDFALRVVREYPEKCSTLDAWVATVLCQAAEPKNEDFGTTKMLSQRVLRDLLRSHYPEISGKN